MAREMHSARANTSAATRVWVLARPCGLGSTGPAWPALLPQRAAQWTGGRGGARCMSTHAHPPPGEGCTLTTAAELPALAQSTLGGAPTLPLPLPLPPVPSSLGGASVTSFRHTGQVVFIFSQGRMQVSWNGCAHGSEMKSSPTTNASVQMAHSHWASTCDWSAFFFGSESSNSWDAPRWTTFGPNTPRSIMSASDATSMSPYT
mmetsp:Transcript_8033/g.20262  ORF Transcript_8033/g.20262 Transcript_8033/m.20262 type:complete len:204 (-) Transcript_8033:393-1004(-)